MTRLGLARYQRWSSVWAIVCGFWVAAGFIVGMKLMFWTMSAFNLTSFPKTLGPAALFFAIPIVAALPVRWLFIGLAQWYGLRCTACRRLVHSHEGFVSLHGACPYCKAPLLDPLDDVR